MDVQQYINKQLQGSLIVDTSIKQLFGKSPIDAKLEEIGCLLNESGILDFTSIFQPKSLTYEYRVLFEGNHYYGAITDETMRCAPVYYIVEEIAKLVMLHLIKPDPEYQFENENEQAMLDAAMDYGFI